MSCMSSFEKVVASFAVFFCALLFLPSRVNAQSEHRSCPGNCNDDAGIEISELITCVNTALGSQPLEGCPQCDRDSDDVCRDQ